MHPDLVKKMSDLGIRIIEKNNHGEKHYYAQKNRKLVGWTPLWIPANPVRDHINDHKYLSSVEKSVELYIIGKTTTVVRSY
jgi:hypothetical protein